MKALITFPSKRKDKIKYVFLTDQTSLENGDLVVVHANDKLVVAIFDSYLTTDTEEYPTPHSWIIDRVNPDIYHREAHNERKRAELEEEMNKRIEILSLIDKYKLLAEFDPKMKSLVEEYERYGGVIEKRSVKEQINSINMKEIFS